MADVGHTTEVTEFKVFISSPSDVETERARCDGVLARLNTEFAGRFKFTGIRWEQSFYTADKTFQAAIPQPSSCDIVVCILWKRLGSELPEAYNRPDGTSRTGTEYEFEEALEAALRGDLPDILVYKKRAKIFFEAERVEHKPPEEAIFQACLLRFRPIMMTTMAALLGGLPLALGSGTGSELRHPLGITIVGGLLVSQALTLYTTPVVYLWFDRLAKRFERFGLVNSVEEPAVGD